MSLKIFLTVSYLLISLVTLGQNRKNYFPIWTFHKKNINIHGVSVGLWTGMFQQRNTNTNGIKIEIGFGPLSLLIPESTIAKSDSEFLFVEKTLISERINGISISSATFCECYINGISLHMFIQIEHQINGLSISGFGNFVQIHKGVQIGIFNESYVMHGFQIGLLNTSSRTKGIQLGIWNRNEKRSLPILNWNF